MHKYRKIIYIFLLIVLITADQLSKYIIRSVGGFYICNANLAFGIRIPQILLWIFWFLTIYILLLVLCKKCFILASPSGRYNTLCIILILSGAISNIIDRLTFGCVIDFIDLKFWPVFNLSDVYITIGVIILIVEHIIHSMKQKLN